MSDLFAHLPFPSEAEAPRELAPGAVILRGFADAHSAALMDSIREVTARAPWQHLVTPGGHRMSVATTSCGRVGWVSDEYGYRYSRTNPESGTPWPTMPDVFHALACDAAARAGYADFVPDACLINRYAPGSQLTLHQDRNEQDFRHPIVSVSLGLTATFLFGGMNRSDRVRRIRLESGDVVVWGGPSRLRFHGIAPLSFGEHPLTGACRINLTFRHAL
jgi:DNA oxidative demethylase